MQFAVIATHAEALNHSSAMHGNFAVGHHHAFRLPGRTRGVNQVRLMLCQADKRHLAGRVSGQGFSIIFKTAAHHASRQLAQGFEQCAMA